MEPGQLRKLQLARLKNTINAAYSQVDFLRRRMDENSVKPDDIKSLADITSMPFFRS